LIYLGFSDCGLLEVNPKRGLELRLLSICFLSKSHYASLERVGRFGSSIGFKQKRFFPDGLDWVVSDLLLEMAVILGDNP